MTGRMSQRLSVCYSVVPSETVRSLHTIMESNCVTGILHRFPTAKSRQRWGLFSIVLRWLIRKDDTNR
jgi:hypothetical protein